MNLFTRFTTTGMLLLAPAAFAASSFEGRVTMSMISGDNEPRAVTFEMKGSATRMDMNGGEGSIIIDMGKRQTIILMHPRHMYMLRPMAAPSDQEPPEQSARSVTSPSRSAPLVRPTGKTEKILGYTCNEYLCTNDNRTTDLWIAPELGVFMGLGTGSGPFGGRSRGGSSAAAQWEAAFKGKVGFPLRVITRDASGKVIDRMEVTKIERGGVSDADFAPPEGYQQFNMPNIPGMNFGG